jgi:hypothetical protein
MDDQHAISGNNTGIITQQEKRLEQYHGMAVADP